MPVMYDVTHILASKARAKKVKRLRLAVSLPQMIGKLAKRSRLAFLPTLRPKLRAYATTKAPAAPPTTTPSSPTSPPMASSPAIPESQAIRTSAPSTTKAAESSALASAKRNIAFLLHPNDARDRPTRLRTRALLRTVRYIAVFVFWRLVRYAKYAVIGSLTAAAAGTVVG
ncbi:hypothetical protein H2201_008609, partial [Coniosporium apollinis]